MWLSGEYVRVCYIKGCSSYILTHLTMYIWLRIPFRELSARAGYYRILRVFRSYDLFVLPQICRCRSYEAGVSSLPPQQNGELKCLVSEIQKRLPDPVGTNSCYFTPGPVCHHFITADPGSNNTCRVWMPLYNFANKTLFLEFLMLPWVKPTLTS